MAKSDKGYTSQGRHSNVAAGTRHAMRADYMRSGERIMNQRRAYDAGKNVVVTIENPNPHATNKRFIRVNARDIWKRPEKV